MVAKHQIKQASEYPSCIPQQALAVILTYLFKQWNADRKAGIVRTAPRSENFLINYYKLFRLKKRLVRSKVIKTKI